MLLRNEGSKSKMKGGGSVCCRNAVFSAAIAAEFFLKFFYISAGGRNPFGAKAIHNVFRLPRTDKRRANGYHALSLISRLFLLSGM